MAALKHWIEYSQDWRYAPMAYWVHIEQGAKPWHEAEHYIPEAPPSIPHKGFAVICVECEGVVLRFSSMDQLEECIRVLSRKPLPTSSRLSAVRGDSVGPNGHWLSRLPAHLKSPRVRAKVVQNLTQVLSKTSAPNNLLNPDARQQPRAG